MPAAAALMMSLLAALPDPAPLEAAVRSDAGWEAVGDRAEDGLGTVALRHKRQGEVDCLEGSVTVAPSPRALLNVAADVPSATRWSRFELVASKVISRSGGRVKYVQLLDNPAPVADRYWFLEGRSSETEAASVYAWRHIDPAEHPDVLAEILGLRPSAVSTGVNVGEWRFTPAGGKTALRYRLCTDAGGSIPKWAGEFAATRTLPANIADLVKEAAKREAKINAQ